MHSTCNYLSVAKERLVYTYLRTVIVFAQTRVSAWSSSEVIYPFSASWLPCMLSSKNAGTKAYSIPFKICQQAYRNAPGAVSISHHTFPPASPLLYNSILPFRTRKISQTNISISSIYLMSLCCPPRILFPCCVLIRTQLVHTHTHTHTLANALCDPFAGT